MVGGETLRRKTNNTNMASSQVSSPGRGLNLPNTKDISVINTIEEKGDDVIKDTFDLLERGEKEIVLTEKYKDVIMVLGNTGSGKTTFTQWVAGDNSKLISKETEEGTGEYIIEDHNKIGNSTFKSKTIFPELVIDAKTNAAYYDCPGFSDTQGTSHEIAETYFIKKVLDFSESIKMVFVINHSSVRKGVDRQDFMKLVRHVTDLVKDIGKFRHSFALIATKVDNEYIKKGKNFILVDDAKVIGLIVEFLQEAQQYLEDNSKLPNLSEKEKLFFEKAMKFVEALLEKKRKKYPRIGIFRRPDMPGPVSRIPLLQNGKKSIEMIVYENLVFTSKTNKDFGYTVSEKTKNDINDLVEEINKNLWSILSNIGGKIHDYCQNLVEQIRGKILLFLSDSKDVDADASEAETFRFKFLTLYKGTSELVNKTSNLTNTDELAVIVNRTIFNIGIPEDDILYIAKQGNYFKFLQTVSDKELSSKPWDQLFKIEETFISDSETIILQDVHSAAEKINNRISMKMNDTIKAIQEECTEQIKSLEIQKLPVKLKEDFRTITEVKDEIKNDTTVPNLVNVTRSVAKNLKVSLEEEILQNIENKGMYLKFLQIISDETLNSPKVMWLSPFELLAKYFYESEKWYTFLEDLYNKFSEYVIQKDRQRYNVADLKDWGQPGKPQGIFVTPSTFEKFLDKIGYFNVLEYETIKNLTKATDLQIEELNQALSLTLKHSPIVTCSEPYLILKGSFIILNDTISNLISNSNTINGCKNFKVQLAEGKFSLLKVFSLNTFFIDTDLSFGNKSISVVIIAPRWTVLGSRTIDLSGADGAPHTEKKGKNGAHPGYNGINGAPGNPGISGESFFGIGSTFISKEKLKIISNGGKGGRGQDAGDGATGVTGRQASTPSRNDKFCENGQFQGFRCEALKRESFNYPSQIGTVTTCKIYGLPGGRGGKGGDGGKGGKGGYPGNITIIEMNQTSIITKLSSKGKEGEIGKGGVGGQGGSDGDDVNAEWTQSQMLGIGCLFTDCDANYWESKGTIKVTTRNHDGRKGNDGKNDAGRKDPVPANVINRPSDIINKYKFYLRENLDNRFSKYSLLQFLEQLNSKIDVKKLYDVFALMGEYLDLEEQFPKLSKRVNFYPFYSSLQETIIELAKKHKDSSNWEEFKKVLNYLYTALLGRVDNLRKHSDSNLIIDIYGYLNLVTENIKTLKDLQRMNNKVEVVNKYNENYKKGIDKKIEEAKSFIEKEISPDIEKINAKIDDEVKTLIKETIDMEKQAEKDLKKLAAKKKELENALEAKGIFNLFKIIGGVASLMGPIGEIAGGVLTIGSTVAEGLYFGQTEIPLNLPSDVVSTLKTLNSELEKMRKTKLTYLNNLLDDFSKQIEKNPEKLGDMKGKIADIRDKLQKLGEKEIDPKQVSELEKELKEQFKFKTEELETHPSDEKSIAALDVIEKVNQVFQFGSLLSNLYNEIKGDQEKVDTVVGQMNQMKAKIKMLKEYEESIYDTIEPMLKEMEDHMEDIKDKLGTKSQVALDVTKWHVQSTLKDMKLQMQELTEGHAVKDDLTRSIEKLDGAMTTLINVYDRIQSYQDQQNLANYIADISSVAASDINIKDKQLVNAVNHLEFVIRANIVLEQYKPAIEALKQWVFPFADFYIETSMLPSELQLDPNIENLFQSATREIETIKQKLDLYATSIRNGDQYLECEEFSSRYLSSQPFFVWKHENYRTLISKLLSGFEVYLYANVKESPRHKDAIKFSEISFDFKMKNATEQALLSEFLKEFDIRATHMGNSYYRYADKISVITSDSVSISFSYEKDDHGIPIRSNEVYRKLKSGDLLLSPYTLWELKLINQTDGHLLPDFEISKTEINLELSGLGSYVDTSENRLAELKLVNMDNNTISPHLKSEGLNGCKRSNHRSARSVNGIAVEGDFMTNDSSKSMSSSINFLCNFLKTYFVSSLKTSINQIFLGGKISVKNFEESSDSLYEFTEKRNIGSLVISNPKVKDTDSISTETNYIEEDCKQKSDNIVHVNFVGNNSCSKSFLLSDLKNRSKVRSTEVPDLNCSLLLADLVTRTITRNRYKSPVHECLLSPREVMLRKISEGIVRNENNIKQILQRHLSEKEEKKPSSWFSKINGYANSVLHYFLLKVND